MTVCNMSIEGGARAGLIAPDDTTYQYIARPQVRSQGRGLGRGGGAVEATADRRRRDVRSRNRDRRERAGADGHVRNQSRHGHSDFGRGSRSGLGVRSAGETDLLEGAAIHGSARRASRLLGHAVNVVFIGSCTNSRISDLRAAAGVIKGRKVNPNVRVMVVPGSQQVKAQAEAEGLDKIFRDAGADFREAGCSMCIAMNGDQLQPGEYSVSTSNRNFEGRQGKGGRTFLASPLTAAAARLPAWLPT